MSTPLTIIRRSDIGLAIAGTRITLYTILDYLLDGWSQQDIADSLNLTQEQLQVALDYIAAHRSEVEAEYADVIRESDEQRQYWEARLQEHLAQQPPLSSSAEKTALYARLAEQRAQTIRELVGDDASALSQTGPTS